MAAGVRRKLDENDRTIRKMARIAVRRWPERRVDFVEAFGFPKGCYCLDNEKEVCGVCRQLDRLRRR